MRSPFRNFSIFITQKFFYNILTPSETLPVHEVADFLPLRKFTRFVNPTSEISKNSFCPPGKFSNFLYPLGKLSKSFNPVGNFKKIIAPFGNYHQQVLPQKFMVHKLQMILIQMKRALYDNCVYMITLLTSVAIFSTLLRLSPSP